jgi:hypothetical protein
MSAFAPGMILTRSSRQAFNHRLIRARRASATRAFSASAKVQLAAHRPLRHLGDLRLDPGIVRQLVDALDGDHGRIHVRRPAVSFSRAAWRCTMTSIAPGSA